MDTLEGKIAVNLDIFRAVLAATSEDMYQYAQEVMTAQPDDIPGLIAANNAKRGVSLDDFAAYQGRLPSRWIWNMLPAPVRNLYRDEAGLLPYQAALTVTRPIGHGSLLKGPPQMMIYELDAAGNARYISTMTMPS